MFTISRKFLILAAVLSLLTGHAVATEAPAEETVCGVVIHFNPSGDFAEPQCKKVLHHQRASYIEHLHTFADNREQCSTMYGLLMRHQALFTVLGTSYVLPPEVDQSYQDLMKVKLPQRVDFQTFLDSAAITSDMTRWTAQSSDVRAQLSNHMIAIATKLRSDDIQDQIKTVDSNVLEPFRDLVSK